MPTDSTALTGAALGQGTGQIHLVNLQCVGNEDGIANCSYSTDTSSCTHMQDAALRCRGKTEDTRPQDKQTKITQSCFCYSACTNGEIRLAGGSTVSSGRVETCQNQQWGTICGGTTWGVNDARVVCRQLGFSGIGDCQ